MAASVFVSDIAAWAPDLSSADDWKLWAEDKKTIPLEKTAPSIDFTDSLFRRRLSQLSKMTVQVVHDLLEKSSVDRNAKIVFVSCRGEIDREFKINKSIIEDKMILPAGFSLSVFNAPIALATIALNLKGGYSALYPANGNFSDGFKIAAAPILSGSEEQIIFVYGDELIPDVYNSCVKEIPEPFAFAAVLSSANKGNSKKVDIESVSKNPTLFLKSILK